MTTLLGAILFLKIAMQRILTQAAQRAGAGAQFPSLTIQLSFFFLLMCLMQPTSAGANTHTNISPIAVIPTGFGGGEQRIEVSGHILCATSSSSEVRFYNLTNPSVPSLIATIQVPGTTHAIGHSNEFFYLSGDGWLNTYSSVDGLGIVTNSTFEEFPSAAQNGVKMKVQDGYLYLATYANGLSTPGEICIFSLADLTAPQFVSSAIGPPHCGMSDMAVSGDVLYACGYFDRQIHAFDISDVENPRLVHTQVAQNHGDYALYEPWRMLVQGVALYVQDDNSWQIFNISNPTNPVFTVDYQIEKDIEGSRLVGNTLVWSASGVDDGEAGVLLYDCSDAFQPVFICRTNFGEFTGYYWVDMDQDYIYQPQADSILILGRPFNTPPSASMDVAGALLDHAVSIPVVKLLANDHDADGDTVAIVAVASTSTLGAPISLTNGLVTYTASVLGENDSFTYTLSDRHGGTATGLVQMTLLDGAAPEFNRMTTAKLSDRVFELRFLGIPHEHYALEWTPSLNPAEWLPLMTNVVSHNGRLSLTNSPPGEIGFYRMARLSQ